MSTNEFGAYLRGKRVAAKMTLREVARQIGLSHVYLGEVERGVRAPLDPKHWGRIMAVIPEVTREELERKRAATVPLQLDISDRPPEYQNLAMALARKIENEDLEEIEILDIMRVLEGTKRE
ncbi:MAG: helix-turn-helix transcriptional regulator [Pseudomonadota bacterium]